MEIYNPYSIVQVSEVLGELTVRFGTRLLTSARAVVISLVNTGLTAIVSVTLINEWRELNDVVVVPGAVGAKRRHSSRTGRSVFRFGVTIRLW